MLTRLDSDLLKTPSVRQVDTVIERTAKPMKFDQNEDIFSGVPQRDYFIIRTQDGKELEREEIRLLTLG